MKYSIIILVFYFFWLYKKSKNNFFKQDRELLAYKRSQLINVLDDFNIKDKHRYLEAFDAFKNHPQIYQFDGATIVKDLHTIYGYDAPAGNHDYGYELIKNLPYLLWIKESIKLDIQYAKDMRSLQIPWVAAWSRFLGLLILKPIYPLSRIKIKNTSKVKKSLIIKFNEYSSFRN